MQTPWSLFQGILIQDIGKAQDLNVKTEASPTESNAV